MGQVRHNHVRNPSCNTTIDGFNHYNQDRSVFT